MSVRPSHPTRGPIPGYHSETAFSVQPEDADAIRRASAYHRKDLDLAVIWFPTRTHDKSTSSNLSASRDPTTPFGEIERLPLELINEICLELDIASLFSLRQTNTRARQIINGLHEYRVIIAHALNPLCALLRTGAASRVTLQDFYRLLCTQACSLCGNEYGNLVYLPIWIRCCSHCFLEGVLEVRVTTAASVKRVLHLSKQSLKKLPGFTTLPGVYTMDERPRSSRITAVPINVALSIYRHENGGAEPSEEMTDKLGKQPILSFMACCAFPSYSPQNGHIEYGVSCAGCQLAIEIDITSDTGVWAADIRDMVYSQRGFLDHFIWCEQAQKLWLESDGAAVRPPAYPYACTTGGYFSPRD
jgi:hypothetical protein